MKNILSGCLASLLLLFALSSCNQSDVPHVENGKFIVDGHSEYFIGTNIWYAPELAATAPGRERLERELDYLKECGVRNLRIKATEDTDADALEYVLQRLEEKGMYAVLYMNNAWEWSMGFRDYLEAAGAGPQPHPARDGYTAYMNAMCAFCRNEAAIELSHRHIRTLVSRLKGYKSIFSWQISNEPRAFASDQQTFDAFVKYIHSTAALIKSIDPVHMVSTGNEGYMGCECNWNLFYRINDCPDIDYITIHIWPYNWSWVREHSVTDGVEEAVRETEKYIAKSIEIASILRKSVVIEEFGYPRDGFSFSKAQSTSARDKVYKRVFELIAESASDGGYLAGCNFWAWGGEASPAHERWQEGDDLCGDPFQEQQGLNSVFASDASTVALIRDFAATLNSKARVAAEPSDGWLFTGKERKLRFRTFNPASCEARLDVAIVSDTTLMCARQDTVLSFSRSLPKGAAGTVCFDMSSLAPGFYQVRASLALGQQTDAYPRFNIGVDPEKIVSPQSKAEDFDAFWERTFAELEQIPMDVTLTEVPEHSNSLRTSYTVEFKSLGGAVAGGILCVPVAEGKYPAHVEFMGYGSDPYWFDPSAEPQTIDFVVSIRDQGIFKADNSRWIDRGLDSKENFYYRGAFCDVKRALDFIFSLDRTDSGKVSVRGESQGGALTLIAAALDHRVAIALPSVPFLGDYPDYYKIVWWPMWEVMETADSQGLDRNEVLGVMSYFDVKNFADRIECPVLMAFGLQDDVCPPHTNFSIWNHIRSPKEYYAVPTCGHGMWKETQWLALRAERLRKLDAEI